MTTLTNQENIAKIALNSNKAIEKDDVSINEAQEKQGRMHTFLANISNKLGLSNAVYFK
jgi:hypothetical protein